MLELSHDPLLAIIAYNSLHFRSLATLLTALFARPGSPKQMMLQQWRIAAILLLLIGILLLLFKTGWISIAFIITIYMFQIFGGSGSTYWFPVLQDFVPEDQRGRFFSRLRASWTIVSLVVVLLLGLFVGENTTQEQYGRMIIGFGLVYLLRNYYIRKLPELSASIREPNGKPTLKEIWTDILQNKRFLWYLVYIGCFSFFIGSFKPILVLYMKQLLNVRDSQNIIISIIGSSGAFMAFLVCGSYVDRVGSRLVFRIAHLLMAALMLGVSLFPVDFKWLLWALIGANVLIQGMIAAHGVAATSYLFFLMSGPSRALFTAINIAVISSMMASSSALSGFLTKYLADFTLSVSGFQFSVFQLVFFVSGALLLLALPLTSVIAPGRYQLRVTNAPRL